MKQIITTTCKTDYNTECNREETEKTQQKAESQKCLTVSHKCNYFTPVQVFQQPQWGWSASKTIETQNLSGKKQRGLKTEAHTGDQIPRIHPLVAFVFVIAST